VKYRWLQREVGLKQISQDCNLGACICVKSRKSAWGHAPYMGCGGKMGRASSASLLRSPCCGRLHRLFPAWLSLILLGISLKTSFNYSSLS